MSSIPHRANQGDEPASRSGRALPSEPGRHDSSGHPCAPPSPGTQGRAATGGGTLALLALLFLASFLTVGCREGATTDGSPAPGSVEKVFERGPVKAVMRLDNPTPSIADRITLEMEVTFDEDHEVEFPGFGERLEQFGIVDFVSTQPALMDGGKVRQSRRYVLEPFLSGEYIIPEMTIRFRKADGSDDKVHELLTEEMKVQVSSLLPEEAENLEIHEIAPPVELPRPRPAWIGPLAGGATVVVLAAILMLCAVFPAIVMTVPRLLGP